MNVTEEQLPAEQVLQLTFLRDQFLLVLEKETSGKPEGAEEEGGGYPGSRPD